MDVREEEKRISMLYLESVEILDNSASTILLLSSCNHLFERSQIATELGLFMSSHYYTAKLKLSTFSMNTKLERNEEVKLKG